MLPETSAQRISIPDFLFITDQGRFAVEIVRAWEEEEKKYEKKIFNFLDELNKAFKKENLETTYPPMMFVQALF